MFIFRYKVVDYTYISNSSKRLGAFDKSVNIVAAFVKTIRSLQRSAMNEGLYHVLLLSILLCPIYSQNVKNSSLIFVIDNTISMSAEVKNVLRSADGVFDAVYNSNKSEIENVIIVTFNDPGIYSILFLSIHYMKQNFRL